MGGNLDTGVYIYMYMLSRNLIGETLNEIY
ncbi:hypothetical protein IC007_2322 [Sulfuracidifex tepidarius]|uniref:Uncharacterized protein n=1 Tax=Sulfuracidifex tepidarius TaxID=1294262 RepID=A0A510E6V5_9CREN|nr:hypothetical protein IC007_2322 [Sulfuracidifex tepidarius]